MARWVNVSRSWDLEKENVGLYFNDSVFCSLVFLSDFSWRGPGKSENQEEGVYKRVEDTLVPYLQRSAE